jgi:O-antigen/teichoic acid export membrane protein
MNLSIGTLVNGAIWTVGAFGIAQAFRLVTSVILARLLAPELFGIMLIVTTLRTGIELITDIGIGQNIIYSSKSLEPKFYNTAWSLQIIRSVGLWLAFSLAAIPAARFYNAPILASILPISGLSILFAGLSAVSPAILKKQLKFATVNLFDLATAGASSAIIIGFAYVNRTVWALVIGGVAGSAVSMVGSHFLLPNLRQRFHIDKQSASEITSFGKWIFVSSIVYFLATNFDRLYFPSVLPLFILGNFAIARAISDLLVNVAVHLSNIVVFPFIASHTNMQREILRQKLASIRSKFLILIAIGSALFIATADLIVKLLYDERYHAASWMLPILVVGAWFSMLAAINESTLLGLGMPSYSAIANTVRLVLVVFGLPLSFKAGGVIGGVISLAAIELCRYVPVFVGQRRERFSFGIQDLSVTLGMFLMVGVLETLRWKFGLGTSFDSLPINDLMSLDRLIN